MLFKANGVSKILKTKVAKIQSDWDECMLYGCVSWFCFVAAELSFKFTFALKISLGNKYRNNPTKPFNNIYWQHNLVMKRQILLIANKDCTVHVMLEQCFNLLKWPYRHRAIIYMFLIHILKPLLLLYPASHAPTINTFWDQPAENTSMLIKRCWYLKLRSCFTCRSEKQDWSKPYTST